MEKIDIVCCSTDNWDDMWRRRQHICMEFSKKEWVGNILYVEPAVSIWSFIRERTIKQFKYVGTVRKINDKIFVYRPLWIMPFIRFSIMQNINLALYLFQVKRIIKNFKLCKFITWFSHPMYVVIAGKFRELFVWYDCTDDWSEMPAITEGMSGILKKQQKIMLKKAGIVTTVSKSLYDIARSLNSNSHLIPNGVDISSPDMNKSAKNSIPEDIKSIKRPILGYIGTIWEDRMDFELIKYVAKKKKDWSLVFVGPIAINLNSHFKNISNVYFLGQKSYHDLPMYMDNFDICVIPHKKNKVTESMNPIKLFEYFKSGKPIVSTDVAGVRDFSDVVKIATNSDEFIEHCDDVMRGESYDVVEKRFEYAQSNSWNKRVCQIEKIINETINNYN